jgi:hypothetical protein
LVGGAGRLRGRDVVVLIISLADPIRCGRSTCLHIHVRLA